MLKVNMDNYRCYLTTRVWIFKSSGQDLAREESFTLWVHHPVPAIETDDCASCDSGDDVTFSFHTCLVYGLDFGGAGSSFTTPSGSLSSSHSFFGD